MISDVLASAKEKMAQSIEVAKDDFQTVSAGRANPALFQRVNVDYYGSPTPLQQLASFQQPEARVLIITPFDKGALKDIERAIVNAPHLGVTPSNDGSIIRITMPELTEERRRDYVKIVKDKAEQARVAIRNVRRQAMTDLDKLSGEVGDDEIARAEKELELATKQAVDGIDEAAKKKESELLEV
ncbi:ribosome recycling factor [Agrococcus sediminis]|uniref:Ribosome-recycling factor n=1 Tax=Agrococcus sediminis TaxID=2599924 RepID=A0A5M8QAS3_9MICO|nr:MULTISPECIES: ribosome recycling factor [Agrococcus]KAA6433087.1 ribosome recycling factor [Agrococcus sediminis]RWR25454.1 ribosome recycling factor [Agrococcus lahaulensis]UOW00735.1 ribosome recycling factor [Agrococcus sp. SCSIO52902]